MLDMANLDNNQQMTMFKSQETTNSILSDTAAENAARQFNATSQSTDRSVLCSIRFYRYNSLTAEQQNCYQGLTQVKLMRWHSLMLHKRMHVIDLMLRTIL